jgi:DNA-binding response OmpR family regulator
MFDFFGARSKPKRRSLLPQASNRVALIVEDDPPLLAAMSQFLRQKMSFHVLAATSYESAVAQLQAHVPDFVCIDLGLPRESGYELCEYVRKQPSLEWTPVLVTSQHSFPEDMAHAEDAGANAFLGKPFSMQRLGSYVSVLLEGAKASRPGMRLLRLL